MEKDKQSSIDPNGDDAVSRAGEPVLDLFGMELRLRNVGRSATKAELDRAVEMGGRDWRKYIAAACI